SPFALTTRPATSTGPAAGTCARTASNSRATTMSRPPTPGTVKAPNSDVCPNGGGWRTPGQVTFEANLGQMRASVKSVVVEALSGPPTKYIAGFSRGGCGLVFETPDRRPSHRGLEDETTATRSHDAAIIERVNPAQRLRNNPDENRCRIVR